MGKEKAQEGGKKFGEVALWDVEAVLSPCQECNSHAAGIPSRSIPLAASAFVATRCVPPRPTNRRRSRNSRETTFPTYVRESETHVVSRLRPVKYRAAKVQVCFHLLGFRLSLSRLAKTDHSRTRLDADRPASYGTRSLIRFRRRLLSLSLRNLYAGMTVKYSPY